MVGRHCWPTIFFVKNSLYMAKIVSGIALLLVDILKDHKYLSTSQNHYPNHFYYIFFKVLELEPVKHHTKV